MCGLRWRQFSRTEKERKILVMIKDSIRNEWCTLQLLTNHRTACSSHGTAPQTTPSSWTVHLMLYGAEYSFVQLGSAVSNCNPSCFLCTSSLLTGTSIWIFSWLETYQKQQELCLLFLQVVLLHVSGTITFRDCPNGPYHVYVTPFNCSWMQLNCFFPDFFSISSKSAAPPFLF